MWGSLHLALLLAGDGICAETAANDGTAGLGEQMVMGPVARLEGLENFVCKARLLCVSPSLSADTTHGGNGREDTWAGSAVRDCGIELAQLEEITWV